MSRVAMVTRTIKEVTASIMYVNVNAGEVGYTDIILSGDLTTDEVLKLAKKQLEDETIKVVSVVSVHTEEKLYGMTEVDFIKLASVLPPRK